MFVSRRHVESLSTVGMLVAIATAVVYGSVTTQQSSTTTTNSATLVYRRDSVSKKSLAATPHTLAEAASQEKVVISLHNGNDIPALQEDVDTAVHQQRGFVATPQDGGDTAIYQSGVTRVGHQNETDTVAGPGRSLRVTTKAHQIIKCFCGKGEVYTPNGCNAFPGGTLMQIGMNGKTVVEPLATVDVVKQDVYCAVEDGHRWMNFTKGQFYWRKRGDIVLMEEAGYYQGLRIENYCITHKLDDQGELTWTVTGCISPPSVPVCCPPGQALQDGACHPALTPELLTPDITTDAFENKKEWPLIRNHRNPINCTDKPLKKIQLSSEESFLAHLPFGLMHLWKPAGAEDTVLSLHTYCVDAHYSQDGSLKYFANMCHSDPKETHSKMCDDSICVRKCCATGEVFSVSKNRCVQCDNATFEPHFISTPSRYNTVHGYPFCKDRTRIGERPIIDKRGYLKYDGRSFPPTDYCIDQFSNGKDRVEQSALACLSMVSTWYEVRYAVFRVGFIISIFFLFLIVLCYYKVPTLLQEGGWYHLCHVLSLMVGFMSILIQQAKVLRNTPYCAAIGLLTQFGFLAAFFWLNILCLDTWRKIRSLNKLMTPTDVPIWVYPLYAFGGPLVIGAITACMQFLAPYGVAGVIKPHMIDGSCWFKGDIEILVYFYGPIAFLFACNFVFIANTYWKCRTFQKNSAFLRDYRSEDTSDKTAFENRHPRKNYISNFKQQLYLPVLMLGCWSCEVLSWKTFHPEVWAFTDVLNSLQGFFIFVIFMANGNKRRHLAERYPNFFSKSSLMFSLERVTSCILCRDTDGPIDPLDIISRFKGNLRSFHATLPKPRARRYSFASDSGNSIMTLSHTHLNSSTRCLCSPGFDSFSSSELNTTDVNCSPEFDNVSSAELDGITDVKYSP